MRNTYPLIVLALTAGLALTGCSGDTPSSEAAGNSADSATPSAAASAQASKRPSPAPSASTAPAEEEQAGKPADQQNEQPAPEDPQLGSSAGGDQRNHPIERPGDLSGPVPVAPEPQFDFDYEEAYSAWQSGMPYYEAFCIHYEPVTPAGLSQCHGTVAGTVDYVTGAYIGP